MKNENAILLDRRGFLKSAAMLAGAAALDISSTHPARADSGQSLTTLAYWYNHAFIDPSTLPTGDPNLVKPGVQVAIDHYGLPDGDSPVITGFTAVFIVKNGSQSEYVPFYAWTPGSPIKRTGFFMPVSPANGILFSVNTDNAQDPAESYYISVGTTAQTAKLRTGTYVVAAGSPNFAGVSPKTANGVSYLAGPDNSTPDFEYILIDVAKG